MPLRRRWRRRRSASDGPAIDAEWHRRRRVAEDYFLPWVERVRPLRGRSVLEYGSGNGAVTAAFAPHADRYIGIEIDPVAHADARHALANRGIDAELHVAAPEEVLRKTATFRGEVDIFLCYAVLEHMSVGERLALLALARAAVRPGGIIVIAETPNRLTPWDYHTSLLPFVNQLPADLALAYVARSPREKFLKAMAAGAAKGPEAAQEALVRWGRGVSFHELELVFDDLAHHVVTSSWEPALLPERDVHRSELALQRVLDAARPDLPAAFSRYWLDVILTPEPGQSAYRGLRPWPLRTSGSHGASFTDREMIALAGGDAVLSVELATPSARVVVGTDGPAARAVRLRQADTGHELRASGDAGGAPFAAHTDFTFPAASCRYEIRLEEPGTVSLVLFDG